MNLSNVTQIFLGEDEVIQITDANGNTMWKKEEPVPPTPTVDYFYIQDESGEGLNCGANINTDTFSLEYSFDGTTWTEYDLSSWDVQFQIPSNGRLYLRGVYDDPQCISTIRCDNLYSVGGNIMSLVDKNNYQTITTVDANQFASLFNGDTNLISSADLNFGNVTTVGYAGMQNMFNGCSSLVTPPDLSGITTVGEESMMYMFMTCTSLVTPPDLSGITTVGVRGMGGMLYGCESLISAPDISNITTIGTNGLSALYWDSTALTEAYAPNVSTWVNTTNWLRNVAATGTLYCPSKELADLIPDNDVSGCPTGWSKSYPAPPPDFFYIKNESQSAGTLTITDGGGTLRYSTDATNWTDYNFTTHPTISIAAGQKLYMKGAKSNPSTSGFLNFSMNVIHSIGGNILSICDETNYATETAVPLFSLQYLFKDDTNLTDASQMTIGVATQILNNGMTSIFQGCTSLVNPPNLSGLSYMIGQGGLSSAFKGCTSLTSTPNFPSLQYADTSAFYSAFEGCTSLTTGSNISNVTTTSTGGYAFGRMYANCSALTAAYAPSISWDTNKMSYWLTGVASSGTVYCPSQGVYDNITRNSASGVPSGWSKVLIS